MRALPLDPSLDGARVGAKAGFDCTLPFGKGSDILNRIPEPPTFKGKRFASVEAALSDNPKSFEELMAAMASHDGREIVRDLEALRNRGRLGRDEEGRWKLLT